MEAMQMMEAGTQASIQQLQRDFDSLSAQGVSHVPAGSKDTSTQQLEALREARECETAALANTERLTAKTELLTKERDTLRHERDALKTHNHRLTAERERLLSLPNPCGIGIKLTAGAGVCADEGGWLAVEGLVPGMAAINSGAICGGDRILAIDGHLFKGEPAAAGAGAGAGDGTTAGAAMVQRATKMLLGKRGSKVKLLLQRESEPAGQGGGCSQSVVELTLKRGAWGAEHAVVTIERHDMLDLGRWPTPT